MPYLMNIIKKIIHADLVKVFSLNAISTLVKMLTGLISVKVVASIVGPAGVALLGQLSNLSSIILGIANGGINNGVTRYVSEYKDEKTKVASLLSNALQITLVCSIIAAIILIVFSNVISKYVMLSDEYGYVFIVFGFTIILYSLNSLLISILNGFKQFRKYVIVNISGSIIGLIISVALVFLFGLAGALINAVTYQSFLFFVTLWLVRKEFWFNLNYFKQSRNLQIVKDYIGYSAMTIISLALVPVSQMLLRGYVISQISITEAGWWESMNRVSNTYLSIITTSLAVYILPRFSEIKHDWELHCELKKDYSFIIPFLIIISGIVFLSRNFIIWLLLSPEFYPMENLFSWQLVGDFFKIASWILSYQMLAKAQTKLFITTEIVFTSLYAFLCFIFLKINGITGLCQGYMINYILYFATFVFIYRKVIFMKNPTLNN